MHMEYVRTFLFQPGTEPGNITEGSKTLPANGPVQQFGPAVTNSVAKRSVRSNDGDAVTLRPRIFRQFRRDQFGSANIERHQRLDNMHCLRPDSVDQSISGAAVWAGGGTGFLDREIDPGM